MSKEEILNNWLDQCFETRSLHFDTIGKIHAAMDEYAQQCCQKLSEENQVAYDKLWNEKEDLKSTIAELRDQIRIKDIAVEATAKGQQRLLNALENKQEDQDELWEKARDIINSDFENDSISSDCIEKLQSTFLLSKH